MTEYDSELEEWDKRVDRFGLGRAYQIEHIAECQPTPHVWAEMVGAEARCRALKAALEIDRICREVGRVRPS